MKGVDVVAGVVDPDYRGELMILMVNCGPQCFQIEKGTRVAQLILERIITNAAVVEVSELPQSSRASGGFGSTGYHAFLSMDPEPAGSDAAGGPEGAVNGDAVDAPEEPPH